jgi:hypothetical protein
MLGEDREMSTDSMRDTSALWWLSPAIGLLLFWVINFLMPLNADDFAHRVFFENGTPKIITSFPQLIQRVQSDLFSYNARLGNIYYWFSLNLFPKWLNNLIVTLWVGSLIFLLMRIALRRKVQPSGFDMTLWLGMLSVIFLPLQGMENFISYTAGLYNYIPGGVGTLFVLNKISRWFIEGEDVSATWGLYSIAFLAGWSNEVYGFFMIPLLILLILWHILIEKKRLAFVPIWVWYVIGSFTLGFCTLVIAPGTHGRALMQPAHSFISSLIMSSIYYVNFALLVPPFCIGVILLLLFFMHKEDLVNKREKVFFSLLCISTMGTILFASIAGFVLYGRALWGIHLVLGIILIWGISRLMYRNLWLLTVPVLGGALLLFGTLIWNTYIIRTEFNRIEQAFIDAGKRGDKVLLVDFPELRRGPHAAIMRIINRVVLVQRDPTHWFNTGLVHYYNALYSTNKGFKSPSYIILDNLVPPFLNGYAYDTKNDPLNHYPEIQSLIQRQYNDKKGKDGQL